jgi:poly(A) polymerase
LEKVWEGRLLVERSLRGEEIKPVEWVRYYARDDADLCLAVIHARLGDVGTAMEEHRLQKERYIEHIDRLRNRRPIVGSARLRQEGIAPGPNMGHLLREAEAIAINEGVLDADQVVARLQALPTWLQERK